MFLLIETHLALYLGKETDVPLIETWLIALGGGVDLDNFNK